MRDKHMGHKKKKSDIGLNIVLNFKYKSWKGNIL